MSYIVMGTDECGSEFRPTSNTWDNSQDAEKELSKIESDYIECRGFWVEELKDKSYYAAQENNYDEADEEYNY